ncbi:hypothetical protein FDP41_009013 [Naegleria fowleri]|uniref:Uncharacterized protein n=1 Tax=Naegleria fowleri TaxID=5763 RepID=A0A6A5BFE9_NAEFO|nr:uncharacterized protein FDP41_009013 [Naegleria fowleri]KAF0972764.1 hypothetical protein FDP41_009013 [Naegleria fowleri]CAG4716426.1 unnamed protein product [Naegleria fowleri]
MFSSNQQPIAGRYYDKSILSPKSQFSYKGGEASCTYICLAAVEYFLRNYKRMRHYCCVIDEQFMTKSGLHLDNSLDAYVDDLKKQIISDIEHIMTVGVCNDRRVGYTSCDEVYNSVDHYKKNLELKSMFIGKLRDSNIFMQLLKEIEVHSLQSEKHITAVVLTKPPETIAILHDGQHSNEKFYSWYIFDSHPRRFEKGGGGFYLFRDIHDVDSHLKELFSTSSVEVYNNVFNGDSYKMASYAMYEATIVQLKRKSETQTPLQQKETVTTATDHKVQTTTTCSLPPNKDMNQTTPNQLSTNQTPSTPSMKSEHFEKRLEELENLTRRQSEEIQTLTMLLDEERNHSQQFQNENIMLRNKILILKQQIANKGNNQPVFDLFDTFLN